MARRVSEAAWDNNEFRGARDITVALCYSSLLLCCAGPYPRSKLAQIDTRHQKLQHSSYIRTISTLTEMLALRVLIHDKPALRNVRAVGTFPACTMRNGSVQKTRLRANASSEAFTAIDSSMGSSGGMTEVMIMVQFKKSLKRSLSGSCKKCMQC